MQDDYKKALAHVAYEYKTLGTAYALAINAKDGVSFVVAFDSFLLHYRTLIEFFHCTKDFRKRLDDLRAEDYVKDWSTPAFPMWEKWKPSLHKLLAHLSLARVRIQEEQTGIDHRRDFHPMFLEISGAWGKFTEGLRGTDFASCLTEPD